MKTISILVILIALNISVAVANYNYPKYSLTIENQQVSGASLHFDLFITSRDSLPFYYSGSELVIDFNQEYFTNPQVQASITFGSKIATNYYSIPPSIYTSRQGNLCIRWGLIHKSLSFQGFGCEKFTDAQVIAELNAKLQVFTTAGQTIKLAHVVLSGISDTNGTAGLRWRYSYTGMPDFVTDLGAFMKADSVLNPGDYPCWIVQATIPVDTAATFPAPANISLAPSKVTSVSEFSLSSGVFSLVPNPVSDVDFSVHSPLGLGKIGIKVVSVLGEEVFSGSAESGVMHFRLPAETASGRYTVRLYSEKGEYVGALPLVVSR